MFEFTIIAVVGFLAFLYGRAMSQLDKQENPKSAYPMRIPPIAEFKARADQYEKRRCTCRR